MNQPKPFVFDDLLHPLMAAYRSLMVGEPVDWSGPVLTWDELLDAGNVPEALAPEALARREPVEVLLTQAVRLGMEQGFRVYLNKDQHSRIHNAIFDHCETVVSDLASQLIATFNERAETVDPILALVQALWSIVGDRGEGLRQALSDHFYGQDGRQMQALERYDEMTTHGVDPIRALIRAAWIVGVNPASPPVSCSMEGNEDV